MIVININMHVLYLYTLHLHEVANISKSDEK